MWDCFLQDLKENDGMEQLLEDRSDEETAIILTEGYCAYLDATTAESVDTQDELCVILANYCITMAKYLCMYEVE
jgi:hypothetical protein